MRPAILNLTSSIFSISPNVDFRVYDVVPAHCKSCNKTFPVAPKDWCCDSCSTLLWDSASDHPNCAICNAEFTFFFRHHHCRRCGRVCCDRCSPAFATFPVWGDDEESNKQGKRVCTECSAALADAQQVNSTTTAANSNSNSNDNNNSGNNQKPSPTLRKVEMKRPVSSGSTLTSNNNNNYNSNNQQQQPPSGPRQASFNLHFILMEALKNYSIDSMPKELLQNSDDANCKSCTFVIDHQRRTLWHFQDGELSDKDFGALGNFYGHSKMTDFTKIGRFGVGFVSCFHLTDKPIVQSRGRYWAMELETLRVEDTAVDNPADDESSQSDQSEDDEEEEQEQEQDEKEKQDTKTNDDNEDDTEEDKKKTTDDKEKKKRKNKKKEKKEKKSPPRQKFYGLQLPEAIEKAIPNVERGAVFCYSFRDIPLELSSVITFPVSSMERCEQVFTSILNHHSILFFLNSVRSLRLYSLRRDGTAKELINNSILPSEELNRIKLQARTSLQQLRNLPYVETKCVQLRTQKSSSLITTAATASTTTNKQNNKEDDKNNGNNLTTQNWWYSCEIVLPEKINAATATAEQKLANAPVTIQLAAPLGDREAPTPIFAVGLPLTGIKSPLLANASATLDLDATRINIRNVQTSRRNHLAVQHLVKNYCHRYLPLLDAYSNENWPVNVDDITDSFMNTLYKSIIHETMRITAPSSLTSGAGTSSSITSIFSSSSSNNNNSNSTSLKSDLLCAPLFGVLFGGKEHLGYFNSLCFLPDKDKGDLVYGIYQRIAMATYAEFANSNNSNKNNNNNNNNNKNNGTNKESSTTTSSTTSNLRLPLISILNDKYQQQYKTVNRNSLTICTPDYLLRQLQQVDVATLDRAGVSDDERLLLLRFFLQSSSSSAKNAQSLRGLPLRQTTRGWSRFDPRQLTFFGDEKAQVTKILLPSTKSDAIASEAMSRIFRVISVPDVVTELEMTHLLANSCALLLQQIEHVIENCKTDASKNVVFYLGEFWKFVQASHTKHRQTTMTSNFQQYLYNLPIVPTAEESGDGKNIFKVSSLSSMICATSQSITTTSGVTPDFLRILTQTFKIPLVHQELMPAIFIHPQATFSKLENFKHIIGLLKYRLVDAVAAHNYATVSSFYKFTNKDYAIIRQYILDNRIALDQYAREVGPLIKMLPIFRLLGGGGGESEQSSIENNKNDADEKNNNNKNEASSSSSSSTSTSTTHQHTNLLLRNARFIPEDLFVQLPSFAKEAALIAVSPIIARALHLPLDRLDDVVRNALTGDRWLSLGPKEQLSIFQWIVQQNKTEMLTDVRVPTMQHSKFAKICDLYYFNPENSSSNNNNNKEKSSAASTASTSASGLDDILLSVSRKYCPELFANPTSSLKDIVEEAVKSKHIKTQLDAPLLKETMRRVISNFRPFNIELKLGQSHVKVWELFPSQYQDIVIVLKELFYFPHHLQSLDQAGIPYCVAIKKIQPPQQQQQQQIQQQQQNTSRWGGFFGNGNNNNNQQSSAPPPQQQQPIDRTKETFQVIITRSENAIAEQYLEIIGGYDTTAVALPPPPPHDRHDGVRCGKKPIHEALVALAQRWRELLSLISVWPNCPEDCKCRRPQFLNSLPVEKGRHVIFLCYIIETELLRIIRQHTSSTSTMRQIGDALRQILPRNLAFLMVSGRPATMLFEAPEDCCGSELFDPLVPVVKEKVWRDLYGIPGEPHLAPQFCKKVLERWMGEHLPSKGLTALTRMLMHLLRSIPSASSSQSTSVNSNTRHHRQQQQHQQNPLFDLSTWMILPNRQATMCRASSLVYIYGSEDSEIMKLLSLDEDISSRLIHPQFSHRRLGSRLDQLGVRNFRDALQLPIQDYKEDANMLNRQQVYQTRIVSDAFAKVLELLLIDDAENGLELLEDGFENPFGNSNATQHQPHHHQDPNKNPSSSTTTTTDPEVLKQQKIDEIKRTVARLKKVQILLVNRLRVSWGNNRQQQQQQQSSTSTSTVKTLDSLPYAIEKVYATIHARNHNMNSTHAASAAPTTRAVTGARFFLLTWRKDHLSATEGAALNCDEEELRSSLVDCILEYLSIDDKLGKKLTYWLKRDEQALSMYLNRRKQEEEKQLKEDGDTSAEALHQLSAQQLLATNSHHSQNKDGSDNNKKDLSEEEKRKQEQEKVKLQFAEQERMRLKKEEDEKKQKEFEELKKKKKEEEAATAEMKNTNKVNNTQIVNAPEAASSQNGGLAAPPTRPDVKSNNNAAVSRQEQKDEADVRFSLSSDDDNDDDDKSSVEDIPTGTVVQQQQQQPSNNNNNNNNSLSSLPPVLNSQSGLGGFFSKMSNFLSLAGGNEKNQQQQQQIQNQSQNRNGAASSSSSSSAQQQQQPTSSSTPTTTMTSQQYPPPSSSSSPSVGGGGLVQNGTKFSQQNPDQKFTLDDPFSRPKNDFNYNDGAASSSSSRDDFLPPNIPGQHSSSSPTELPKKQIPDTPCAIVDDIVPWVSDEDLFGNGSTTPNPPRPGWCKIYITKGATLPKEYRGQNVMKAIESFSIVLKEISVLVDPDSFKHCAVYWSTAPSNTLAFNSNGSMFFNLSFYIRDPDPHEWMGTFLHEYAHNSVHDHGLMFVKALQSLSGRVIKRLLSTNTPDP